MFTIQKLQEDPRKKGNETVHVDHVINQKVYIYYQKYLILRSKLSHLSD